MEHEYYHLLAVFLEGSYDKLRKAKEKYVTWEDACAAICGIRSSGEEMKKLKKIGIRLLLVEDPEFPRLLREMPNAPHALYVRGALMESETIAIVGTRKATELGLTTAYTFAEGMALTGMAVVSGLAIGIDGAAHDGCIRAGGKSVAVLPCGIDIVYPSIHKKLAERILEAGGALISEYPPGTPPLPYRFLERNRIVSGLSRAIIVIEAPTRSGSLVTARFALEQNREIFVVPGPVNHKNYRGSHALIRSGGRILTSIDELLEDLGMAPAGNSTFSHDELMVMEAFAGSSKPLAIDEIIERTKLTASAATIAISMLTLKNVIRETGGGYTI